VEVRRDGVPEINIVTERFVLPDGRAGAKWNGLVFPLHDDSWIDADEAGVLPGQCRPWLEPSAGWRWQPGADAGEGYVFLDGTAAARDQVSRLLAASGIAVVRTGPNMSGEPGDWFIRVAGGDPRPTLERLLGAVAAAPETGSDATLRERLLGDALERVRLERDQAHAELALAREKLAAAMVVASAEAEATSAVMASISPAAAVWSSEPIEAVQARPSAAIRRLDRELSIVIEILLPRLALLRDSLAFMAVELSDRTSLWRALAQLDREGRGRPADWKNVAGCPGWWERHFSTGHDNQGRVYARHDSTSGRWSVLVSHKQEQPADIRHLRKFD
jgi:hypothetical protein